MQPRPPPHAQNLADPRMFDSYRTTAKGAPFAASFCEVLRGRESGKRVSNPRPSAWEADALPTELLPLVISDFGLMISDLPFIRQSKIQNYFLNLSATNNSFDPAVYL